MVSARILAAFLVLMGSILPELLLGGLPAVPARTGKPALLLEAAALCLTIKKWRGLWRFALAPLA